jgi:phosphocarrier protein HPr
MEKEIMIKSTTGLHASLAAKVVQAASKYNVDIELHYQDKVVDLKSILALMSLAVPHGENVRIIARGTRAEEAIKQLLRVHPIKYCLTSYRNLLLNRFT